MKLDDYKKCKRWLVIKWIGLDKIGQLDKKYGQIRIIVWAEKIKNERYKFISVVKRSAKWIKALNRGVSEPIHWSGMSIVHEEVRRVFKPADYCLCGSAQVL
jgi:hypothetical protein